MKKVRQNGKSFKKTFSTFLKKAMFLNTSGNSFSATCFRDAAKTEEYVPKYNNKEE